MNPDLHARLKGKAGIRFFGDIHGCAAELAALAEDAVARNLHLHSLGDLINRGPDSPGCMRLACDLHDAGWLDINPGNHDVLFCRWFKGEPVPVKPHALGTTAAQLWQARDGHMLARRYFDLMMAAPLWSRFGRLYAVHAALDAETMLGRDGPRLKDSDWGSAASRFALEGETRAEGDPERPALGRRSFAWLDAVPAGVTVMIGHSVASTDGLRERRNALGGRIVHLDTGLQRGGRLSYVDVPLAEVECDAEPTLAVFAEVTEREIREARAKAGKGG
ncbi:MAG TPA: metallophosphoesterase [Dongiaceae bacterium]|nr:metallophosphoesterase [Dongiaceae bacterium]